MNKKFRFDPKTHTYYLGGVKLPSFTGVAEGLYPFPKNPDAEFYMSRGAYIHKCCEMLFKETLNFDKLPDEIKPYVESYSDYANDNGMFYKKAEWEKENYHKVFEYGFKPDTYFPDDFILDDIKTGTYQKDRYKMQLIVYMNGLESQGKKVEYIRTILLTGKGYKIYSYRIDREAKQIFRTFINQMKKYEEGI